MRWVGLSNVQRLLAGWLVTPQLMGRSVTTRHRQMGRGAAGSCLLIGLLTAGIVCCVPSKRTVERDAVPETAAVMEGRLSPRDSLFVMQELAQKSWASGPLPSDEENICRAIYNSYECARKIEQRWLTHSALPVERDSLRLVVQIANGPPIVFRDTLLDQPDVVLYSYRQYYPSVQYHLIEVQYYEGGIYILLDGVSGDTTLSHGIPVLSPDTTRFVAASQDLVAGYFPTGIQIWRIARRRIELEFTSLSDRRQLPSWGPAEPFWLDASRIRFDRIELRRDGIFESETNAGYVFAVLGAEGWSYPESGDGDA